MMVIKTPVKKLINKSKNIFYTSKNKPLYINILNAKKPGINPVIIYFAAANIIINGKNKTRIIYIIFLPPLF